MNCASITGNNDFNYSYCEITSLIQENATLHEEVKKTNVIMPSFRRIQKAYHKYHDNGRTQEALQELLNVLKREFLF